MDETALRKGTMLVGSYYDSESGRTVVYEGRHPYPGCICMFGVGLLVDSGDIGALSEAITRLVGDRLLAERLGRQAQVRVRERFDIRQMALEIERVYLEIVGEGAPHPLLVQ